MLACSTTSMVTYRAPTCSPRSEINFWPSTRVIQGLPRLSVMNVQPQQLIHGSLLSALVVNTPIGWRSVMCARDSRLAHPFVKSLIHGTAQTAACVRKVTSESCSRKKPVKWLRDVHACGPNRIWRQRAHQQVVEARTSPIATVGPLQPLLNCPHQMQSTIQSVLRQQSPVHQV